MCLLKRVNWVTASFLVLTPLVAVIWGGFHIVFFGVYPFEVVLFLLYIAATTFSITAGYHRHFAHGAYECRRFVKAFYLALLTFVWVIDRGGPG
jgi:stearoyl-CoA desaturase (Delta-9 desaturase)